MSTHKKWVLANPTLDCLWTRARHLDLQLSHITKTTNENDMYVWERITMKLLSNCPTCKWTVHIGHSTSFIRLPDPSDFEPVRCEPYHLNKQMPINFGKSILNSHRYKWKIQYTISLKPGYLVWQTINQNSKQFKNQAGKIELKINHLMPSDSSPSPPIESNN